MMGRGRDAIQRAYTGDWGSDARRDRRIDRARRKEALEREVREALRPPVVDGVCLGPSHDHCDHLMDEDRW